MSEMPSKAAISALIHDYTEALTWRETDEIAAKILNLGSDE